MNQPCTIAGEVIWRPRRHGLKATDLISANTFTDDAVLTVASVGYGVIGIVWPASGRR